jgi:hypothetical protein
MIYCYFFNLATSLPQLLRHSCFSLGLSYTEKIWVVGVARNRELVFIITGKLHVGLAWKIHVTTSLKQLNTEDPVEVDWHLISTNLSKGDKSISSEIDNLVPLGVQQCHFSLSRPGRKSNYREMHAELWRD